MKYVTLCDLSQTIRKNIWKVPRDIDFIIGVPRSGMLAASIIASYLNVPLISIEGFLNNMKPSGGNRLKYFTSGHIKTNKILVVDDTVYAGTSMNNVRGKLSALNNGIEFIYMCVYLEGIGSNTVDIWLEDLRQYTNNFTTIVLYEWNILQHNEKRMLKCLYDIDGVLCLDPPDERKTNDYLEYIKNATPLFIPRTKIGGIVTYRLEVNRGITEEWLAKNGIKYNELVMFNAKTWDERHKSGISPEGHKATFYKNHSEYDLFVESDDHQARRIRDISRKAVYCVESNTLYQ